MISTLKTGNHAIDEQHANLDKIVNGLEHVCADACDEGRDCSGCDQDNRCQCSLKLEDLLFDLLACMADHFTYEENLMRTLPPSPVRDRHIDAHTFAHAEISRLMSELTAKLDLQTPLKSARELQKIAAVWMGKHTDRFDSPLALAIEGAHDVELLYDIELGIMLS
jgi:hemerythrin-like metal-binding protein